MPTLKQISDLKQLRLLGIMTATVVGIYVCYLLALPFLPALTWAPVLAIVLYPADRGKASKSKPDRPDIIKPRSGCRLGSSTKPIHQMSARSTSESAGPSSSPNMADSLPTVAAGLGNPAARSASISARITASNMGRQDGAAAHGIKRRERSNVAGLSWVIGSRLEAAGHPSLPQGENGLLTRLLSGGKVASISNRLLRYRGEEIGDGVPLGD